MIVSVSGQMIIGFGLALLLNRAIPYKGLITTLLLLPMMMSAAVVGLFWRLLYDPSWGIINYAFGLGNFAWLSNPQAAPLCSRDHRHLDVGAVRDAALSPGSPRCRSTSTEAAAIDRAGAWYTFTRITLPLVTPLLLIALIFRTMEAFKTFDIAYVMSTQPTTELIAIKLYKFAFQEFQTGKSCALAYIVLIMVLAITNISREIPEQGEGALRWRPSNRHVRLS